MVALWRRAECAGRADLLRRYGKAIPHVGSNGSSSLDGLIDDLKKLDKPARNTFITELRIALGSAAPEEKDETGEFLSWTEINQMVELGVLFGSHTNTHQILTATPPVEATKELRDSRNIIESKLGSCSLLAYPNGDWSPPVRDLAEDSGYQYAFANSPGVWGAETHHFSVPRINIWEGKLTNKNGQFSKREFEYAVFWKAYRASRKR